MTMTICYASGDCISLQEILTFRLDEKTKDGHACL